MNIYVKFDSYADVHEFKQHTAGIRTLPIPQKEVTR